MIKRLLVLLTALFVIFQLGTIGTNAADSQQANQGQVVPLPKGKGPWTVTINRCSNQLWLAEVMRLSNVQVQNVRQLPVNQKIVLPANCSGAPSAEIAARSKAILAADQNVRVVSVRSAQPIQSARSNVLNNQIQQLQNENKQLQDQNRQLSEQLANSQKENQEKDATIKTLNDNLQASNGRISRWWLLPVGLLGLLGLGLAIAQLFKRDQYRRVETRRVEGLGLAGLPVKQEMVPVEVERVYDGKPLKFKLYRVGYECPLGCGAIDIKEENIDSHLEKVHGVFDHGDKHQQEPESAEPEQTEEPTVTVSEHRD